MDLGTECRTIDVGLGPGISVGSTAMDMTSDLTSPSSAKPSQTAELSIHLNRSTTSIYLTERLFSLYNGFSSGTGQ